MAEFDPEKIYKNKTWQEISASFANTQRMQTLDPKIRREFYEWMLTKEQLGLLFDFKMYYRCFQIQKTIKNDRDHFIVILGKPGS